MTAAAALALGFGLGLAALPGAEEPPCALAVEPLPSPAEAGSLAPSLAAHPDGGSVLSWLVAPDADGRAALRLARRVAGGWSEPRTVARGTRWFVNWADVPAVAAAPGGALAASWLVESGDAPYAYGAWVAASHDGASWSEPVRLHEDDAPVEHGFVSLLALGPGRFLALWLDGRELAGEPGAGHGGHAGSGGGAMTLRSRILSLADGALALGPESLVDGRVCDCCPTALAGSAAEGVVALWRDRSPGEVRDVAHAFWNGASWSAPAPVHADGWRIDGCPVNGPRVAVRDGRVAAAWFTGAGGGAVRVAVAGAKGFGAPLVVDDGAPEGRVALCWLADGSLLVAWLEHERGGATWRLRRLAPGAEGAEGLRREASLVLARVSGARASGIVRLVPDDGSDASAPAAVAAWTASEDGTSRVVTARVSVRRD